MASKPTKTQEPTPQEVEHVSKQIVSDPSKTYKSFTVVRREGGWSMLTTTVEVDADGNAKVTDVKASEPDILPLAKQKFKIAFVKWTDLLCK